MSFLDLLYPKQCLGCKELGSYLCANCFAYIAFTDCGFCTVCERPAISGLTHPGCMSRYEIDGVFSSVIYKGIVKRLIYNFKYKPYIYDLKEILSGIFYEGIIQNEGFSRFFSETCVFVPIPLHKSRMRSRGYNQSMVLAKGFVDKLGKDRGGHSKMPILIDGLERVRNTPPQFGLSQTDRRKNMKGAFVMSRSSSRQQRWEGTVFLIDDIVTTGSTFREAARVLKREGASLVYGLSLAHGQ